MKIIEAIADELKEHSNFHVRHLMFDPMMRGESIRVKKTDYDHPMAITLVDTQLHCKVVVRHNDSNIVWFSLERGGYIDLIEPNSIEQLLEMLERDLKWTIF